MRLIDADKLPKYTGYALSADEVAKAVEEAPTVDAVEVVRCKDCEHSVMTTDGQVKYCKNHDPFCRDKLYYDADYFCADGERKEVKE